MPRKSERISSGSVPTPQHKRAASNSAPLSAGPKETKRLKAATTKSKYFKDSRKRGEVIEDAPSDVEPSSPEEGDDSDFGDEPESSGTDSDNDDKYSSEREENIKKPRKVTPKKPATSTAAIRTKENELLKPGVKTGLGPGTQVIIKKPKARAAGKTPYQDETIHPNTLLFLKDLKANNERSWLKMHDADFRQSERDWHGFVEKLTERLIEVDDTVPELPVKDVVFRIYRDVRFSKIKTPYKAHFSAAWSRTGRKGPFAHYYVQISPDNESFIGGGLWHPEAAPIAAIRRDFDRHPRAIKNVLMDDRLRKEFLSGAPKNEAKCVKAFVSVNAENALKTKPKNYDADHPDIDLLRLRNYTIGRKLTEAEVLSPNSLERIAVLLSSMKPFITYLNSVVMPDEEIDEDEEDNPSGDSSDSDA